MVTIEEKLTTAIGKLFGKAEKKEPLFNTTKLTFQIENTNVVRDFAIDRSLNPEQIVKFLRCRWNGLPPGCVGLYVEQTSLCKERWLPNEPIEKCLTGTEKIIRIRAKSKFLKIALPDGSLRTHLLDMTVPMSSIAETIADKMHLPKSEYACCIEFDKESSQLETAIRILSSAKSLIGLSKKIKVKSAMKSELSKKIRSPLWLDPTRTLTELEPLINARPLCFRRRFWFSSRPLDSGDKGAIFTEFQEIKEHLKIVGTLVRSCSIGLADAAKLVAILNKIENPEEPDSAIKQVAESLFPAQDSNAIIAVIKAKRGAGEIRLAKDEFSLQEWIFNLKTVNLKKNFTF